MPDEHFMRHHYGASGYVDPHAAYEVAYQEFEAYWMAMPFHLREDNRLRAASVRAFLHAKGFEHGTGKRI